MNLLTGGDSMKYYFYTGELTVNAEVHKFSGVTSATNPGEAFRDIVTKCKSSANVKDSAIYISKLEVIE